MKQTAIFLLLFLATPIKSFAFFCPTNFNQIDFGATIDQVMTQCGKPDQQMTTEVKPEAKGPQEWDYYIAQTVSMNTVMQGQGTLKTSFTFDKDDKLINISVNGLGVGATTICGNNVQLGDSRDMVKAACGTPTFVMKQSKDENANAPAVMPDKMTQFNYNSTPPVKLIFKNGVLEKKE